jgi:hypothetical protein
MDVKHSEPSKEVTPSSIDSVEIITDEENEAIERELEREKDRQALIKTMDILSKYGLAIAEEQKGDKQCCVIV